MELQRRRELGQTNEPQACQTSGCDQRPSFNLKVKVQDMVRTVQASPSIKLSVYLEKLAGAMGIRCDGCLWGLGELVFTDNQAMQTLSQLGIRNGSQLTCVLLADFALPNLPDVNVPKISSVETQRRWWAEQREFLMEDLYPNSVLTTVTVTVLVCVQLGRDEPLSTVITNVAGTLDMNVEDLILSIGKQEVSGSETLRTPFEMGISNDSALTCEPRKTQVAITNLSGNVKVFTVQRYFTLEWLVKESAIAFEIPDQYVQLCLGDRTFDTQLEGGNTLHSLGLTADGAMLTCVCKQPDKKGTR